MNQVLRLSEGYPYFIQEYGRHVWRLGTSTTNHPWTCHVQAASKIRDALMRQSRVYSPEYGYVAFTVPQCADYLRHHHPLEELLRE